MNHCECGCGKEIRKESRWAKGHNPNKTKDRFDWSNVEQDYEKHKSIIVLAEMYGCTHNAVHYQLKKRGIICDQNKVKIDGVAEMYDDLKSARKIAEIIGCSPNTVLERLNEVGIKRTHDNKGLDVSAGLGRFGEKIALCLLSGALDITGNNVHAPFDLLWNGKRIDVKVSRPSMPKNRPNTNQWIFGTGRNPNNCDYYFCIGLNEDDEVEKVYLIPSLEVPKGNIRCSRIRKSKYHKYEMKGVVNENGTNIR